MSSNFGGQIEQSNEYEKIIQYILMLKYPEKREHALSELNKNRENFKGLAPLLWYSVGTVTIM